LADKPKAGGAILITVNYVLTLIKCTAFLPLVGNGKCKVRLMGTFKREQKV